MEVRSFFALVTVELAHQLRHSTSAQYLKICVILGHGLLKQKSMKSKLVLGPWVLAQRA